MRYKRGDDDEKNDKAIKEEYKGARLNNGAQSRCPPGACASWVHKRVECKQLHPGKLIFIIGPFKLGKITLFFLLFVLFTLK